MGFGDWHPQTVLKFVRGFSTSAHTAEVETDAGRGYLKAMGGKEGPHTLASEVVATQLANWLGLPTFDCAIIGIDEIDEIPFLDRDGNRIGVGQPGPAFITRAEKGSSWSGRKRDLNQLVNPQDLSALVLFDTWVLNCDRYGPRPAGQLGKPRINRDNVFLSAEAPPGKLTLKAMDHTHCFSCGREWTPKLFGLGTIRDGRVFGLFPEFRPFLDRATVEQTADRLRTIDRSTVMTMVQRLPNEWDVSSSALDALVNLILGRARFVADIVYTKIWPQQELPMDDRDDAE